MDQRFETIEYEADLSRDEYIRSQEVLNGNRGFSMKRLPTLVLLAGCFVLAAPYIYSGGKVDWSLVSLLAMMLVSEVWTMLTMRGQMRRRAGDAYDATIYSGYSFSGVVSVEEDAVRKRTASATAVISFDQCRLFVETADMMIFCAMDGKSIVIPARFLTAQTAEITRAAALQRIPPYRRMMIAPVQPAVEPAPVVCAVAEPQELLTLDVEYADGELVSLASDMAMQGFWDSMPNRCLLMTLIASLAYFVAGAIPVPVFLTGLLVMFLFTVAVTRIKMRRAITRTERQICRLRVEFTDQYVSLIGKADGVRPLKLPWSHITRAVEYRDTVEFYTGKIRQLSIPKRCIEDFDALSEVVDGHMTV